MTEKELQQIRERVEKATPGPWNVDFTDDDFNVRPNNGSTMRGGERDQYFVARIVEAENKDDVLFAMYAREDIPALLAEVERLRAREFAMQDIVAGLAAEVPSHRSALLLHKQARAFQAKEEDAEK